mmetsp:Transcript_42942/g.130659  ORF Transcript_42942/g.130659 Transcript_42942/m.130659 type:complete len:454 (-) Transcript_42942:218-1579(-)
MRRAVPQVCLPPVSHRVVQAVQGQVVMSRPHVNDGEVVVGRADETSMSAARAVSLPGAEVDAEGLKDLIEYFEGPVEPSPPECPRGDVVDGLQVISGIDHEDVLVDVHGTGRGRQCQYVLLVLVCFAVAIAVSVAVSVAVTVVRVGARVGISRVGASCLVRVGRISVAPPCSCRCGCGRATARRSLLLGDAVGGGRGRFAPLSSLSPPHLRNEQVEGNAPSAVSVNAPRHSLRPLRLVRVGRGGEYRVGLLAERLGDDGGGRRRRALTGSSCGSLGGDSGGGGALVSHLTLSNVGGQRSTAGAVSSDVGRPLRQSIGGECGLRLCDVRAHEEAAPLVPDPFAQAGGGRSVTRVALGAAGGRRRDVSTVGGGARGGRALHDLLRTDLAFALSFRATIAVAAIVSVSLSLDCIAAVGRIWPQQLVGRALVVAPLPTQTYSVTDFTMTSRGRDRAG